MAINTTSDFVLKDAFMALSSSSLLQIAKHCEKSVELAKQFNHEKSEQIAFVKDDRVNTLKQLAAYCYKAIDVQLTE